LKILFVDLSCKIDAPDILFRKGVPGMVQSLFKVSDYLSSKGHKVTVMANIDTPGSTVAGTMWINPGFQNEAIKEDWDVLVSNRGIGDGFPFIETKRLVLWTHDLPHNGFAENPDIFKQYSLTIFMSKYAEKVWRAFYPIIGKSVFIPNGVDKKIFYPREKDLGYLIYFAHPIRGLNRIPLIYSGIKGHIGEGIHMKTFSSRYDNIRDFKDNMDFFPAPSIDEHPEGLEMNEAIPSKELGEEVGRAGLFLMPTGFHEICANVILQSMASGTPIITTGNIGSAGEWVKDGVNGILTEFIPADYMVYQVEVARKSIELLKDKKKHLSLIDGAKKTMIYSWEEIGDQWEKTLLNL
jgi:glycosyltransferase involved in cell wall biosynthesis